MVATLKQRNFRAERCSKFLADIALHHPRTLLRLNRAGMNLIRSCVFVRFDDAEPQVLGFLVEQGYLHLHHHDRAVYVW